MLLLHTIICRRYAAHAAADAYDDYADVSYAVSPRLLRCLFLRYATRVYTLQPEACVRAAIRDATRRAMFAVCSALFYALCCAHCC